MTDRRIVLAVVFFIGAATVLGVALIGAVMLTGTEPDPAVFAAFAAALNTCIGGLIGLLVSTRSTPPNWSAEVRAPEDQMR